MKLVCPHCAKVIEVPESAAGQTTSCPLCQGPLTVPFSSAVAPPASVPPAGPPATPSPLPPPPPSPPPPDPLGYTTPWTPSRSGTVVPPLPQPQSQSTSGSGVGAKGVELLGKLQHLKLPPGFHEWFGLGVLAFIFVMFFFPWVGVYLGNIKLVEQSGLAVAFGYASATKEGQFLTAGMSGSTLIVFAFLASLVGLLLLLLILVEKMVHAPAVQNMKPTLQRIAALRDPIVLGCLVLITLVFLFFDLFSSFPLEQAAWSEKANDTMLTGLKLKAEGIEKVISAEMVGMQWLQRKCWFSLATLVALVSTLWIGYRWLSDRGYTRRWPKVVVQWPATESPGVSFDAPGQTP